MANLAPCCLNMATTNQAISVIVPQESLDIATKLFEIICGSRGIRIAIAEPGKSSDSYQAFSDSE